MNKRTIQGRKHFGVAAEAVDGCGVDVESASM